MLIFLARYSMLDHAQKHETFTCIFSTNGVNPFMLTPVAHIIILSDLIFKESHSHHVHFCTTAAMTS